MRLYSRLGATTINDPQYGEFVVDEQGGVDLPEELGLRMRGMHVAGMKAFEDDAERAARLASEEAARRKDPATLLAAVEALATKVAEQAITPAPAEKTRPSRAKGKAPAGE